MRRRYFARAGRRSAGRRILIGSLAGVLVLALVAAGAMALRGPEIARQVIQVAAGRAGIPPDRLEVRRIGLSGMTLGAVRLGGPEGPAASSIEIGWSPASLWRGRVGRVRIDDLTVHVTVEQGQVVIAGLPRDGEGGGGMVVLPIEQIDLNAAKIAMIAGTTAIEAAVDATLVPLDSGAIVGRAVLDAVVRPEKSPAIRAMADVPEWRVTRDDAGLQFAIVGASVSVPDHKVAASAIEARFISGPQMTAIVTAAVRDEAAPARMAPLAVALQAQGEQDAIVMNGRAGTADEAIAATFSGRHVLSSGRGHLDVAVAPVKFAADGRQPRDLFPIIHESVVQGVEGTVAVKGAVSWGAALASSASVTLDHVGFDGGLVAVSDLSGTVHLTSLLPPRTAAAQHVTATIDAAGLPPMPLDLRFSVSGNEKLVINQATLGFAGGTLGISDTTLATGQPIDLTLNVRDVDLGAVLGLLDIDGLTGTGTIGGAIPARVEPKGAALKSGQLAATVPGVMRYTGGGLPEPAADAPDTDPMKLMRAALADFHYTGLTLTLDRAMTGEGSLLVNLKGANPQVLDNYPFVFNIRLDANFDRLAAILFDGYAAAENLIRRGRPP
jgi:hypothetical protein